MSLNNIELPSITLQSLYAKSLVELKTSAHSAEAVIGSSLNILGRNLKRIVIVVRNVDVAFLQDDELNFLLGILAACKLNMDDVCILNMVKNPAADYHIIGSELSADKIILFDVDPAEIKLPLSFPYFQVQRYNGQTYLSSPSLTDLQHDKAEKTKLWNCLKQIFSI
jgi:DNA polymerase III psi subunit